MIKLNRLRPTRMTLAAVGGLLWAASFGAVRDFVWADLRAGRIDLRGLGRATRALAWLGFALLGLMIAALLFNDLWRARFPLVVVSTATEAGRGALLPVALVPLTFMLLSIAWSFILAGALHSHPALRLGVLLLYLGNALAISTVGVTQLGGLPPLAWMSLGAVALVLLLFVLRWRAPARPALEFTLLLAMVATTFGLAQWQGVQLWRLNEIPIMVFTLSTHIQTIQLLVLPLLFLIGVDIAGFTERAAGWTAGLVGERLPRSAPQVVLCCLILWRLRDVGSETAARIADAGLRAEAGIYANALLDPLVVAIVWWLVQRLGRASSSTGLSVDGMREAVERRAMPLILAYTGISIVFALCLSLAAALPTLARLAGDTMAGVRLSLAIVGTASAVHDALWQPWRLLVDGSAVVLALWLTRRGHAAIAVFLGIFGLLDVHHELMTPGMPLARFGAVGAGSPVDFWWVMILAAVTLALAGRRQLTAPRATALLVLTLITALLRQTDFIEDPFSPFFGFAGIAFIAFGIIWDVLTNGSWANESSRALPRNGRVFLYIGYALITVTVINWAVSTHDLRTIDQFTGQAATTGLERFGRPLLYALGAAMLAALHRPAAVEAPSGADEGRIA